jgi:riboflavin kinase/FMN adenylyltransferase
VAFLGWIRAEAKFASADELIARMHEDARLAHQTLARTQASFPPLGEFVEQ